MNRSLSAVLAGILGTLLLAGGCTAGEKKPELKDLKDKVSYSIGLKIGRDFQAQEIEVDVDLLARGIRDVLAGGETLLTDEQAQQNLMEFQQQMVAKQEAKLKEKAEKSKQEGEAFLAGNAKKEGVVTLPSGLQYQVIEEGAGVSPTPQDTVTVHYAGTLVDGTEFDSSYKRGQPATFPVGGVIPGWTEALQLMKEGARYKLFIPSSLAYGERGAGPVIGPNSVLVFEVELLDVQGKGQEYKPEAQKPAEEKPAAK